MHLLAISQSRELAETLADIPEHTIAIHALRTGRCEAAVEGPLHTPAAVVIDPFLTRGELIAWGTDPEAIASLASRFAGWSCLEVSPRLATDVMPALERLLGQRLSRVQDVYHIMKRPAPQLPHPAVRLLAGEADADLYARCAPAFQDVPADARRAVLEGPVAAAIIDGTVVGAVEANVRTARHANMCAEFLATHRGQGMCTAAAALAAGAVQKLGLIPVWSAAHNNGASIRVAQKVGYEEVSYWVYLLKPKGS